MTDDLDAQMARALRALEREPASDGRAAVARRVSRRRLRRSGTAVIAIVATAGITAAVVRTGDARPVVAVDPDTTTSVRPPTPSEPAPPPLAPADTGILTFPTTIAPGDDLAAVLRNPMSGANVSCFLTVRLERWNGDGWDAGRELIPKETDPNLTGRGAECAADLMLPGAFLGERTFTIPSDAEPGYYRLVDESTEGQGRITVASGGATPSDERPVGEETIDLSQGADLIDVAEASVVQAVLLNDNRLAIAWDSSCNGPGRRIDFDYQLDRVTVQLFVGYFRVTDCLGEPTRWSTVVDLPVPLFGRGVLVASGDRELRAERIEATPISTFVLPGVVPGSQSPPIVATSIVRQRRTPVSIQLDMFGATCIANAQSVVLRSETGEIFVQPHVQVLKLGPAEDCFNAPSWHRIESHVSVPAGSTFFGPEG